MSARELELRLKQLETEVAGLKKKVNGDAARNGNFRHWKDMYGCFADDSEFEKAMRLGRKWRKSFGRKTGKKHASS